jgi:aldehyde:ferredoxin oxidoreductase
MLLGEKFKDYYVDWAERVFGTAAAADPRSYEAKGRLIAFMEKVTAVSDIMLHCRWHGGWQSMPVDADVMANVLSVGTGERWTGQDLMDAAARLRCLERAFEVREGIDRKDDTVPQSYFEKPLPGRFPDDVIDRAEFEKMKDEYYESMGWDVETGVPTPETLNRLDLEDVAGDLAVMGKLPARVQVAVPA